MRIKVRRGTVDHGKGSLCESCRWSVVIRGQRLSDEIVECSQLSWPNRRIPFAVSSCSDYASRTNTGLREMEEMAWILRSDPHRNQVGFVRSSKLPDDERYVLEEE